MQERKIKILMHPSDQMGVGHWRTIWPAKSLMENFGDEVDVEINMGVNVDNIDYLSSFDVIHFHRALGPYEKSEETFNKLRERGVIVIMDIDDYWDPPITHPLYEIVKQDKLADKILNNIRLVDCVTTTTGIFKDLILKYNKNVEVIPNALDMDDKMWKSEVEPNLTDKCRIAFIGGSSHLHDLKLMEHSMNRLNSNKELEGKYQLVLCGFDTRGTITQIQPDGQRITRKILPHETVWCQFENICTSNLSVVGDEDYKKWLLKIKNEYYQDQEKQNYVRRWTLPLTQYGRHYDYCDVCLAPLLGEEYVQDDKGTVKKRTHLFNFSKSELKVAESGMKNKVLIAQDFGIYKKLIKDGENGLLVSDNKDGWYKAIRKVILDKELREKLAYNLHEFVKDRYELKNVTRQRLEFYKRLIKEKEEKLELLKAVD